MIAVTFEVEPHPERRGAHLDYARSMLEEIDGFISVERFESLTEPANFFPYRSGAMRQRSTTDGGRKHIGRLKPRGEPPIFGTIVFAWQV